MMKKGAYLSVMLLCMGVVVSYYFIDYIGYFEEKYGVNTIDAEKYPVYTVYKIRMETIYFWFRTIYFSALLIIVLYSLYVKTNAHKFQLPKYLPLLFLIFPIICLLAVSLSSSFSVGTLLG